MSSESKGELLRELKEDIFARALKPRVAVPIEPEDEAAALLRGVLDNFELVPRQTVSKVAAAIVGAMNEAEKAKRVAGGKNGAKQRTAIAAERQKAVKAAFENLSEYYRDRPFGAQTMDRILRDVTRKLGYTPSIEMLKRDYKAIGISSTRSLRQSEA
jgi:hypothetical protein